MKLLGLRLGLTGRPGVWPSVPPVGMLSRLDLLPLRTTILPSTNRAGWVDRDCDMLPNQTGIVEEALAACSVAVLWYLLYFALLVVSSRRHKCQYLHGSERLKHRGLCRESCSHCGEVWTGSNGDRKVSDHGPHIASYSRINCRAGSQPAIPKGPDTPGMAFGSGAHRTRTQGIPIGKAWTHQRQLFPGGIRCSHEARSQGAPCLTGLPGDLSWPSSCRR